MSWNLYKPGQGYWTRLLSAVGGGILVVAGVAWLWDQLSVIRSDYTIYLQAGLGVLILLVFGVLIYRLVAVKPSSSDFLIATEGEMKKVNWPGRKEVIGSTWVVIATMLILAGLLFVTDLIFSTLFRSIGILDV